jgi:hypothetical protein
MTILELLVAFMVLLMLVGALVTLTTRSLDTWTSGETRKEMYDRARTVLDAVAEDLRNVYAENEVVAVQGRQLQVPLFASDLDRNRAQRLRFVRTGNPAAMKVPAGQPQSLTPAAYYTPLWEVAYVMHPDGKPEFYRGVRGFDRQPNNNLLRPPLHYNSGDPGFQQRFGVVETGILYVGFKFWTQYTNTWDDTARLQRVAPNQRTPSGPERVWDSSRRVDPKFYLHRRAFDLMNPDFVYPEIVEVTVVAESGSPETTGVKLMEGVDDKGSAMLRLSHTRGLPDAPGMVKVEGEWIEYGDKTGGELLNLTRGSRQTAAGSHAAGTPVRFGETFVTEVRIAVYREAQEP